MGSSNSKNSEESAKGEPLKENLPKTPVSDLKILQLEGELDPRSPSSNITRTPLQFLAEKKGGVQTAVDSPVAITPCKAILATDPRSPTIEYQRTPIIVGLVKKSPILKIHNKNLDKALKGYNTIATPVQNLENATPKKSNIIPPRLLESSPIKLSKVNAHKRRSFVGILETNIDYTETDLDEVISRKYNSPDLKKATSEPKIYGKVQYLCEEDDIDPRSPTTEFLRTPIQTIRKKMSQIDIGTEECSSSEECNIELDDSSKENMNKSASNGKNNSTDFWIENYSVKAQKIDESEINSNKTNETKPSSPITEVTNTGLTYNNQTIDLIELEPLKIVSPTRNIKHRDVRMCLSPIPRETNVTSGCNETNNFQLETEPGETVSPVTQRLSFEIEDQITGDIPLAKKGLSEENMCLLSELISYKEKEIESATCFSGADGIQEDAPIQTGYGENNSETTEDFARMVEIQDIKPIRVGCDQDKYGSPRPAARINQIQNITPIKIDLTADVRDFDKKLTNLIYEDDSTTLPATFKVKEGNRTPLGVRNTNSEPIKRNRLKVSDKPRKSNSKIPVSNSKNCRKADIQCENTPPRNMLPHRSGKLKKPQWDTDNTLII